MAFITDICRVFNNCPFAYLSPNLGICPRMSGSISIMFLVTSPGPGLKPDTWQRPPKDVSNECMNDLEIRKKKGKDGDARYLLPWRTSGDWPQKDRNTLPLLVPPYNLDWALQFFITTTFHHKRTMRVYGGECKSSHWHHFLASSGVWGRIYVKI